MPTNLERAGRSLTVRRILLFVLVILAIITVYQLYRSRPAYEVRSFKTPMGWGYDIVDRDNILVHQPTMPGLAGERGFASEAQAQQIGELVITKLKQGKGLPTITPEELQAFGISQP